MNGAHPSVILYHAAGQDPELAGQTAASGPVAAKGEAVLPVAIVSLAEVDAAGDSPAVLLLDRELAGPAGGGADARTTARLLDALPGSVVVVAMDTESATQAGESDRLFLTLPAGTPADATAELLRSAVRHAAVRFAAARTERELVRTRSEIRELNRIGMALTTQRDPDRLLVEILDQAKRLSHSDAGTIFLVEQDEDGAPRLRFKLTRNDSLPELPLTEYTLPMDPTSVAGFVTTTLEPLVLDDAYRIPEDAPYTFNRSFDERFAYRTKSLLVVPMADQRGVVVGVLQLINRKRSLEAKITSEEAADAEVLPYGEHEIQIVRSLAGQAAVSIENAALYRQIERIFESFVKASVSAIDQRDPTTAGHSVRVATMTCDMAEGLARVERGPHAGMRFSRDQMRELRYAALLHDFGKVGVREAVLVKAKKLPPTLFERVEARFDLLRRTLELEYHRRRAQILEDEGADALHRVAPELDRAFRDQLEEVNRFHEAVLAANEPAVLPEESAEILSVIAGRTFAGPRDERLPYLTPDELHFLTIPKGSLDDLERKEIESHVEQTYRFLRQIPWTDDLRDVAEIAYGHHEKLDGRGYPRGIRGERIPVQTRIMTIADIFDALTASDRPYKPALSPERALDILLTEARAGLLDPDLVHVFVQGEFYRKVLETDWREL